MTDRGPDSLEAVGLEVEEWEMPQLPARRAPRLAPHVLVFYRHDTTGRFLSPDDARTGRMILTLWRTGAFHRILVVNDSSLSPDIQPRAASTVAANWLISGGVRPDELLCPVLARAGGPVETMSCAAKELRTWLHPKCLPTTEVTVCGARQDVRMATLIFTRHQFKTHELNLTYRSLGLLDRVQAYYNWLKLVFTWPTSVASVKQIRRRKPRKRALKTPRQKRELYRPKEATKHELRSHI